jgi:hypothetical protein
MKIKNIITLITALVVLQTVSLYAQTPDTTAVRATAYFHEAEQASAGQKIWPLKLYGPMMFVDGNTRTAWANMPDSTGVLKPDGEVYKGVLPNSVIIANTSVKWGGREWSMILWPLPVNHDERLNLVMHESFHRIQEPLKMPQHSPTADHLDTREGRIYLLLELQALKSALNKPVNARKKDLEAALIFRKKRELLFPATFNKEVILEANEGIAEYTGVILGRQKDSINSYLQSVIDYMAKKKSLIRSAPYTTGPVYGYLLYNIDTAWTLKIDSTVNFANLIEKYYHVKINDKDIDAQVSKLSDKYNGAEIIASENLKYAEHEKLAKQYTELFTQKPVLIISLVNMHVGFNPSNLFDLGKYGTVYPTMTINDNWGDLTVTSGTGALMKDWQIVYLSVKKDILPNSNTIEGDGWKLTLANGWKVTPDGANYKIEKTGN